MIKGWKMIQIISWGPSNPTILHISCGIILWSLYLCVCVRGGGGIKQLGGCDNDLGGGTLEATTVKGGWYHWEDQPGAKTNMEDKMDWKMGSGSSSLSTVHSTLFPIKEWTLSVRKPNDWWEEAKQLKATLKRRYRKKTRLCMIFKNDITPYPVTTGALILSWTFPPTPSMNKFSYYRC